MVTIRKAEWRDAESITHLFYDMHQEIDRTETVKKEHENMETIFLNIVTRIKLPDWVLYVADLKGKIIGFIMNQTIYPRYNPVHLVGFCEAIYVLPEYRGKGIDVLLLNESFKAAQEKGVKEIECVVAYNSANQKVRERAGFTPTWTTLRLTLPTEG